MLAHITVRPAALGDAAGLASLMERCPEVGAITTGFRMKR
jgi:hypothetical protein